jgi:hypothetical protein
MLPIIFRGNNEPGFFVHAVGMRSGPNPLEVLPGNQRTDESRYACLIVVKDYHRMRSKSANSSEWHYSQIEPDVIADVRAGRAILVFDLSNEGPAYDSDIFDELYTWIENHRLPPGRCIWLAQNRLMGTAAAAHAGGRARMIEFERYDYFVKLMAWNFSVIDAQQRSSNGDRYLGVDGYLGRLCNVARKDKLLLCLNATPRLARVLTIAALYQHQLLHRSLVSFPGMRYVKSGVSLDEVFGFIDAHPSLASLRPWVQTVARMAPQRVDEFQEQGNALVEKIDRSAYERTYFSLVTESDFSAQHIERVTEKTVKAFCLGHPALIVGNTHSVDIMRAYGFEDWSDLFDRHFDSVVEPAARFDSVLGEALRQTQRITEDPAAWLDASREVSTHNHRYAVSGAFLNRYIDTYDRRLIERMASLIAA